MVNYIKRFWQFLSEVANQRRTIVQLTKNDFRSRYVGSFLGIAWAFIQPACTIMVLWFVFEVGFRTGPVQDCPYVLWLMAGLLPWNFFSDSLSNATNSVLEHNYLVKKVVFRVSILPIVKICSSLIVHVLFISIMFILLSIYYQPPSIYNFQIFYYLLLTSIFVLGLSWLTSSVVVFIRDLGQLIMIFLQFGFWLTPIFWSLNIVPEKYRFLIRLNPCYYLIEGYRNTFVTHHWFWEDMPLTIYFFAITTLLFLIGATVFMRLKPHFADVI